MQHLSKQIARLYLFWMLVFFSGRLLFFICTVSFLNSLSFFDIIQSFYQGFFIDLSTFAYATLLPILLSLLAYLFSFKWFNYIANGLSVLLITLYTLTTVGESILYLEWQAKLSMQALAHFANPSEVFKTASLKLTVLFFVLSFVFAGGFIILFVKKFLFSLPQTSAPLIKRAGVFFAGLLLVAFGWIVMIRGGLKAIPIQLSDAYYTQEPILNDAAVNPAWNLVSDLTYFLSNQKNTIYTQLDNALAEQRIKELYHIEKDTTSIYFLSNTKPNIVFIILESWTAHCVKSFGGDDFAPFVDSLAQQGIYFSNAYPAGHVSDQGIAAILSGQPVVSRMSVVNQTSKSGTLPSLNETLKPYGYSSGFYFGGDLNYGNIRGYLFNKKWDIIKEERDYSTKIPKGKLGIQDKEMARIFVDEINNAKQPFIYAWFTLSSHMPYDFEGEKKQLTEFENDYTNSIIYTDQALKLFFEHAKKQAWYSNTLFVICADHSHANHKNYRNHEPMYHQIPMLFVGDVIQAQYRGYNYEAPSSQINIAKTLLHQMELRKDAEAYVWSQDVFNPYIKPFAYFCSFSAGGMVSPIGSVSFSLEGSFMLHNSTKNQHEGDSLLVTAKAFQQMVFEDYVSR